jgi:Tfp pilus assembly protein PilF
VIPGLPLDCHVFQAHFGGMRHFTKYLLALLFASSAVLAQSNLQEQLHTAFVLEQQGQFNQVIMTIQPLIDSHQVSGYELGNACIMLGMAYDGAGEFIEAQHALDCALHVLEHDPQHVSEYAATLQNYASLYSEIGQLDTAASMWLQALKLRQELGDHTGSMRSLSNLAGLALSRNKIHQAREYLKRASDEMKLATDLVDDDFAVLSEMRGWLAMAQGHAPTAVMEYQRALELGGRIHGEQHWLTGWEHMLLGKAYAQAGDTRSALVNMQQGLSILEHALGPKNPKYFIAQIAYSKVLDQTGSHAEAVRLRGAAQQARKEFYGAQCTGCTISKAAFQ